MKKLILYILFIGGILLAGYYVFKYKHIIIYIVKQNTSTVFEEVVAEPVLGVFTFNPEASSELISTYKHYRLRLTKGVNWKKVANEIAQFPDSTPTMITVETWGEGLYDSYRYNPMGGLLKGDFDDAIKALCTQLIGNRDNVYIRFNPEKEVPVKRYPWQRFGGVSYIEAYRHFSKLCKEYAPKVKLVWGPAGYPGAMEYYPGDDVVDAAAIIAKSESEMALEVYPKDYTIDYDVFRRLHRLRFIDKPIFILGSQLTPKDSINTSLLTSLANTVARYDRTVYSTANFNRPQIDILRKAGTKLEIGLYDPQALLNMEKPVTVEHLFVDFENLKNGSFEKRFKEVISREHDIIVTFEPFRNPNQEVDFDVLQNVSLGKYDHEIDHLYCIIANTERMVYLRYAHEMEIPITRYPWQSQDPIVYINSFRYFMNFPEKEISNIKRVWGPAGDRGSLEWWPGNDVVDIVSIAIYGLPDKNIIDPEKQESFETIFNRKIWRLRFLDKPIFITEFGVKGPEEYQTRWLKRAAEIIAQNSQLIGVNYFNMSDTPKAWGEIKPPDWSITKKSFLSFTETLNREKNK